MTTARPARPGCPRPPEHSVTPARARPSFRPAVPSGWVRLEVWHDPRVEHAARSHLEPRQEADTLTGLQRQTATRLDANRPQDGNHYSGPRKSDSGLS